MTENLLIGLTVGGTVVFILVNRGDRLGKWVNNRHYYSWWAKPFRFPLSWARINVREPAWRGEFRMRRRLQRKRRAVGLSIHSDSAE